MIEGLREQKKRGSKMSHMKPHHIPWNYMRFPVSIRHHGNTWIHMGTTYTSMETSNLYCLYHPPK